MIMPDYNRGINISTYTSSTNQFTAPCAGIIMGYLIYDRNGTKIYINNQQAGEFGSPSSQTEAMVQFSLSKNDIFYTEGNHWYYQDKLCHFYPLKGAM